MFKKAKNKKRAFTLIELMAVVIILGVISTITVTAINYTIARAKEKLYTEQISRLEAGAKEWSVNNTALLPTVDAELTFFSIQRLKDEGVINAENVVDPRTNQELTGCLTIQYNNSYQQYLYDYIDSDCSVVSAAYEPVITLTTGDTQFTEVNGIFVVPEATAKDYAGRNLVLEGPFIKKNGQIVVGINTSIVGDIFTLTYSATDEGLGLTKNKTVTVTVNDTIPPVICVGGNCDSAIANFEANANFVAPAATVTDNSCGLSGTDTSVNNCIATLTTLTASSITPQVLGTYNVTYTAEDNSHNPDSLIVAVTVTDTIAPLTPTYAINLNTSAGALYNQGWTNQNVWLGNFASVENGTGVLNYQYSLDCATAWQNISALTYSTDLNTSYCLRAIDYASNPSGITARIYVKVDKTAPTCASSGGNAAWTNANRTLTGTCNDAGSGCASTTITKLYSTETNSTIETPGVYSFTDNVGNVGSGTCLANQTVKIDKSSPTCSASSGGNVTWTNVTRVITGTCSDTGGSGCSTANPSNTYSTEINTTTATPTPVAVTLTDAAGNSASVSCPANQTVKIDKTAPTCSASSGGNIAWTNGSRIITGTCSDTGGSGCVGDLTSTYSTEINTTTASPSGTVSDVAGNSASVSCPANQTVKIDKTAPTCSASSGGSAAWTNATRVITGTCSDALSGCSTANPSNTYSTQTSTTTATPTPAAVTLTDAAGNSASVSCPANQTVNIDKTAPTCASSGSNASWTNGSRTLTGTCNDSGGSGCASAAINRAYSTEINSTVETPGAYTFSDNAGNSASSTCPANQTVRIDKTAPSCSVSGGVGSWTNQTVTLVGTCSDALSGCATNASTTYSGDTFNNSAATGNVSDNAGNATACAGQSVYVDKTAPSAPSANLNGYASGSWTNGNVTTTLSSSDALSGVASYQYTHDQANFSAWPYNPWIISWDGQWSFWARAIDAAGNVSGLSSLWTLRIDKTGPTITSVSCPRCNYWVNAAEWYSYVYWTATDGGVGISQMQYSINQGTPYSDTTQPSGNPSSFSSSDTYDGQYAGTNFYLRAVDALGNIGPWAYVGGPMYRDTSYPLLTGTWSNSGCTATSTVTYVSDLTSGLVSGAYLRYTGSNTSAWGVYSKTAGCGTASCTLTWQARDNAGNISGIGIKYSGCLLDPSSGSF